MLSAVGRNADLIPTIGVSPIVMTTEAFLVGAFYAAVREARVGRVGQGGVKNAAMTVIADATKNASMLIPDSFLCL